MCIRDRPGGGHDVDGPATTEETGFGADPDDEMTAARCDGLPADVVASVVPDDGVELENSTGLEPRRQLLRRTGRDERLVHQMTLLNATDNRRVTKQCLLI